MAKENNSEKILDTKQKLYTMQRVRSALRSNENAFEHTLLIVVLTMLYNICLVSRNFFTIKRNILIKNYKLLLSLLSFNRLEFRLFELGREKREKEMLDTKQKLYSMQKLRSELRSNENAIEHLPQIVVLIMLILMRESEVAIQ